MTLLFECEVNEKNVLYKLKLKFKSINIEIDENVDLKIALNV